MEFIKKISIGTVLVLLINISAYGQTFNKPGVTAAQFLKIGITARAEAMGQSVAAFINDASATYYNPSGLMNIENNDLVVAHTFMPAGIGFSFAGLAHRFSDNDVGAVSVIALQTDEMKIRTVLQPEGTGQKFITSDYAFGIHYAHNFTTYLRIGFTMRYLYLNLVSGLFAKHSWSADMGIQYDTNLGGFLKGLKIGMVVANFGPEVRYINESYGLPMKYVVGISKQMALSKSNGLIVGLNWVKSIDERQKAQIGLEYNFNRIFYLRSGYKLASGSESWAFGFGVKKRIMNLLCSMDYSLSDYGLLGNLHRLNFGLNF